ncbi:MULTISPECIES: acyltransferase [Erwinia]|uniref:acyltransferase family protein n=1 Tax=Erwinia TaxID=551 RepID=UPI0010709DF4|nr:MULTISPECIES: acyltransferase [Erwinia]QBR52188.1 acyltransferase [Erwinia sp. QL-Z3]QEW31755.1 acyltransferase [Erwinia billingiae]
MLKSIHYTRGFAALLVVLFHFSFMYIGKVEPFNRALLNGGFGVDLFFLISGFIITYVTAKKDNVAKYFLKRFFRIYPLFLFILVISSIFLIRYNVHPIWTMIKSGMFILQDYNRPAPEFDFNFIGPAWTLSYEIWFYFVFGIAMMISHRYRVLIASAMLLAQVFLLQLTFTGSVSLNSSYVAALGDSSYVDHALKFFSTSLHLEFLLGMWLCETFNRGWMKISPIIACAMIMLLVALSGSLYFSEIVYGSGLTKFYLIALPLFVAIIIHESNFRVFNSRIMYFFGDISFSIYISHFFIMYLLIEHPPFFWMEAGNLIKLVTSTLIAIVFAYALHRLVELPFIKIGRKLQGKVQR